MPTNITVRNWTPSTYNPEKRSVQATIATESPVKVFDLRTMDIVDEVLLMSGAEIPDSGQVPLLDSHQRGSVRNVLGSCRNIRTQKDQIQADVHFADDNQGQITEAKVRDGHITDMSIGYQVKESVFIEEGTTERIQGKTFEGPVRVATSWELMEASVTPIGADKNTKTRSQNMPLENNTTQGQNQGHNDGQGQTQNLDPVQAERARCAEIQTICKIAHLPEFAERFIQDGSSIDQARQRIFKEMTRINPPIGAGRFQMGDTDGEKRSEAMIDGMVMRSGYKPQKVAQGAENFRQCSLVDIARECLELNSSGSTRGMSASRIIRQAMQTRMHTTDDFPKILENVGNKILREAYINYPSTFEPWTVKGEARDFKQMSRVQLSEAPDLEHVPESAEYMYGTFGESKEKFAIQKYGRIFRISWEAMVNDDLRAFDRVAKAFVQAAKRGLNAQVYKELTDNSAMSDGVALFHANHNNLASGGDVGTISIDTLTAARLAMRTQTGLQTSSPLNIEPFALIVPASLETTADQVINTMVGLEATEGAGARNPFYQKLSVITEPYLDGDSTVSWYLTANPQFFDTVEVAYLDGEDVPYLDEEQDFTVDAWSFKVRFCFGVKSLDYRGLYKNPGE